MIQAIYRSNFVIMGLPIAINIYGHGNVGLTAVMVAIVVPVYNVMAVVTLETFRDGHVDPVAIAKRVARNPLILGAVTGIVFVLLGIRLPEIVGGTVEQLAACATPIALLILGASFKFSYAKSHVGNLTLCVVSRLFVVPAVALSLAAFLGFRGIAFVTLIAICAAPCAISSFTMAQEMDSDGDLAGSTVVFTSALCCLTMFGWLFLFKNLGMF